jgi:DNA polymerase-3 subunit delta
VCECGDAVRQATRQAGFTERVVMDVDKAFDWGTLAQHADALSLFAEKRLLELRMPRPTPGKEGAKALLRYAEHADDEQVLLVTTGKLESRSRQTAWYKGLDKVGCTLEVWPVKPRELAGWIRKRASSRGLKLDPSAAALLAERVEGNLLACAQELNKLALLHGEGATVAASDVLASAAESARYSVYELVDAALGGLRQEGVEPALVNWAVARGLREVEGLAMLCRQGMSPDAAMGKKRVWDSRRPAVGAALARLKASAWQQLLTHVAGVDRIIKRGGGNPWDALERVLLAACGIKIGGARPYNGGYRHGM